MLHDNTRAASSMSANGLKNSLISAFDPRIQWVGRVAQCDAGMRLFWSGSGFVVSMRGTGLSAAIVDPNNRFTLVVDGAEVPPTLGPFASGPRTLIAGLSPGEHSVSLLRRSEPLFGETLITELGVQEGYLLTPQAACAQIEVLGDSISCGYGNEAAHTDVAFSVHTENHYHTYAALLARALKAPLSTIAWSGRGVIRNHADSPGLLMPLMYDQTLPLEQDATPWHFGDATRLVLINLGTNDFSAVPGPDPEAFIRGYVDMLETVRARRLTTPILCTLGPMLEPRVLERAQSLVQAAVRERRRRGDSSVHFHALATKNLDPGTNSHPSVATHERMASELLQVVRDITGRQ